MMAPAVDVKEPCSTYETGSVMVKMPNATMKINKFRTVDMGLSLLVAGHVADGVDRD
jgi:hypothetical protein